MDLHTRMPFGKHRGVRLMDVPSDYLAWVITSADAAEPCLKAAARAELLRRSHEQHQQARAAPQTEIGRSVPGGPCAVVPREKLDDVVQTWFRRLARKYHPDVGGSHQAFVAISDARDQLVELVGSL